MIGMREKSSCFERRMKMPIVLRDLKIFGVAYRVLYILNMLLFIQHVVLPNVGQIKR